MVIQPIDTEYNGYKFRSRLEARWAIFFDELQIPYSYEPEGFNLNGVWYLPDFHLYSGLDLHHLDLPEHSEVWIEVKHSPDLNDNERQKISEFVQKTDNHILLIAGQPDLNVSLRFIDHHPTDGWFVKEVRWIEVENREFGLIPIEKLNNSQLLSRTDTAHLRFAIEKAKQARFEHKKDSGNSNAASGVKCKSCGRIFFPEYSHHYLCNSCYFKRERNKTGPVSQKLPFESVISTKEKQKGWKKYIPVVFLFMFLLFVGIFAIYSLQNGFVNSISSPTATATFEPAVSPTPVCNCDRNTYDCRDFTLQTEAQACFDFCFSNFDDVHNLDNNDDRLACESLP